MRCRRISFALLLAAAVATTNAAAQEIHLPPQAGPFVVADSTRFESSDLGRMYTYRNPAENVTGNAYVYPVPADRLRMPEDQQIAREAEIFVAGLAAGIERGWYDNYEVVVNEARTFDTADGPRPAHLVAAVLRRQDGVHVSFMHLVVLGNQYVKTRLTMPAEQWRESLAPNFGLDLFKQLPAPARVQ